MVEQMTVKKIAATEWAAGYEGDDGVFYVDQTFFTECDAWDYIEYQDRCSKQFHP